MTKFSDARAQLYKIDQLALDGKHDEVDILMNQLYAKSSLFIALGPNDSIKRVDGTDARDQPDQADLAYYKDTFLNINYAPIFKDVDWGEANVVYDEVEMDGQLLPTIKVFWANKKVFIEEANSDAFNKKIEAIVALLTTVLGARWYMWQIYAV